MELSFTGEDSYNFLLKLAYERFTGSEGERKSREYIVSTLRDIGYEVKLEDFNVNVFSIRECSFYVLEPWFESIPCEGVGFSGSTPEDGVIAYLKYVETLDQNLLFDARNKIILVSELPQKFEKLLELLKYEPAGIVVSNSIPGIKPRCSIRLYEASKKFKIPTISITYEDATKLVKNKASKVKLKLLQDEFVTKSYNIVFEKRGEKYPDEIVVVGAHYDSVRNSFGIIDNASSVALLVELAKILFHTPIKRTVRFILFSGEELGLRGSMNYCETHKDELEKIKLMVNLDVNGSTIGSCNSIVTGNHDIKYYLESISKELGINLKISQDIMSSDSNSFSLHNVPSVSFFRGSGSGIYTHTCDDDLRFVSQFGFKYIGTLILNFLIRILNAEVFPFSREIPEDIKKKVKEYFKDRGYEI